MQVLEKNKKLCERYPFLIPRNRFTGEIVDGYDYTWTELDAMPSGWRESFGEKMCEEIREALLEENYLDEYRILQIKEKYAGLRWYSGPAPQRVYDIVEKYENLSEKVCIECGSMDNVSIVGNRWILPLCNKCKK